MFWGLCENRAWHIVHAAVPLDQAEPYGNALTDPRGHAEVWEAWQTLGPAGLSQHGLPAAILENEYDQVPRGRVVYHRRNDRFTLYADRRLQRPAPIARIVVLFGLTERAQVVRSDAHYRN